MTEEQFLSQINEFIEEQDGLEILDIDDLLINSEMDSFSYAFFWAYFESEVVELGNEYVNGIDYETYTIRDLYREYHERS